MLTITGRIMGWIKPAPNGQDVLLAIRQHPGDSTRVLAYAAQLEQTGRHELAALAGYIRTRHELAHSPENPALLAREASLLGEWKLAWEEPLRASGCSAVEYKQGLPQHVAIDMVSFVTHGEKLLQEFPTVTSLRITGKMGDDGAVLLGRCAWLKTIHKLDCDGCAIGDAGAAALAASHNAASLKTLELWNNTIGDAGVIALATSWQLCGLRYLNVWGNSFGESGMQALAQSITLIALRQLDAVHPEKFAQLLSASRQHARSQGTKRPLPQLQKMNGQLVKDLTAFQ